MRTRSLVTALSALGAAGALAQVEVKVDVQLPTLRFAAPPPLVPIEPGIEVVPDHDEEVFVVDGWYWCRRGPHWYRSHGHHGDWAAVEVARVPPGLARIPPGHYKRWKPKGHGPKPAKIKGEHGKGRGKAKR